jgi:hypothetical protein
MSCCFIILTCEKYLNTRVKWVLENSLFKVEPKDIYFLSCEPKEPNIYGWNTPDIYEGCPLKYIKFFQNMTLDYDWYFFMDDDTFIFTDKLKTFISQYDKNEPLYIGNICRNYNFPIYMSGGAGFLMTKSLYLSIVQYIRETPEHELFQSIYGDLSIGLWLTNIEKKVIEASVFNAMMHKNEHELDIYNSFHYLKNEEDFKFYKSLIDK